MFNQQQSVNAKDMSGTDAGLRQHFLKVYNYMASALVITGLIAYVAGTSTAFMNVVYENTLLRYAVMFAPLAMVFFLSFRIHKLSENAAKLSFYGFAVLMGLSMFYIFQLYAGESIAKVFFITAITFGATSLYGYTTKRDLSGMGSFLMMGVIGIIIASVVNMFMQSDTMGFVISIIGVLLFTALTAYDTQKVKAIYYQSAGNTALLGRAAIMSALELYLDFINMFIFLLRLLGNRD